ncbi:MAG: hypothetical protein C0501_31530 [Isosphaera sp.]|nr:hypothetical protein [Isosphaera sp.]
MRPAARCPDPRENDPLPLTQLLRRLDDFGGPIPLRALERLLVCFMPEPGELQPYERFDDRRYRRNSVRETAWYEAVLICWLPGQRSPIHDHRASACGVRVTAGHAEVTDFDVTDPARPRATASRRLGPGEITVSFDRDAHRVAAADSPLVTLHLYSPPLRAMTTYPDEPV